MKTPWPPPGDALYESLTGEAPRPPHTAHNDPAAAYHAHLDVCQRCASQPFNLCPTGARLLEQAVL